MNNLITWLKAARLRRIVLVFISGLFLFVGTACGNQQPPLVSTSESAAGTQGQDINLYDRIQEPTGGMNNYNDIIDSERSERGAARARNLIDTVERNRRLTDDSGVNVIKEIPAQAEAFANDAKSNISSSVQDLRQSLADYPDRTQRNLSRIGDYAQDKAEDAVDNAQDAARNAASNAKARARDIKGNVEDLAS